MDGTRSPLRTDRSQAPLGAFYTPKRIALALAEWSIRRPVDRVFDPSFGTCAFLEAAARVLSSLGAERPGKLVFGVDLDPIAAASARSFIQLGAQPGQFLTTDFLETRPEHLRAGLFEVILGNPPYVRHHNLGGKLRGQARRVAEASACPIPARASYWVYFLAHSLGFLAQGGRMAMVLPGSFLHAYYARPIQDTLLRRFRNVGILLLQERVFENTQEESVILLADGFGTPHESSNIGLAEDVEALKTVVAGHGLVGKPLKKTTLYKNWLTTLLPMEGADLYSQLENNIRTQRLGDWARVEVGTVTGANAYFLVSARTSREWQIPRRALRRLLPRASFCKGLAFTDGDWHELVRHPEARPYILDTNGGGSIPTGLKKYLDQGIPEEVRARYKCRTRHPWHGIQICDPPDAFFQYMSAGGPRLVLNRSKATCTNSLHIVNWRNPLPETLELSTALSMVSSLSQLSAELVGRSYGGGVLKLEPSEATRLLVAIPSDGFRDARIVADRVDSLLRSGRWAEAIDMADKVVLRDYLGLADDQIDMVRKQVQFLRVRRLGRRKGRMATVGGRDR